MTVTVDEFDVADPANAWTRAGFSVDADSVCRIGNVGILSGLPSNVSLHDVDSVPTTKSEALPATPGTHANGVRLGGSDRRAVAVSRSGAATARSLATTTVAAVEGAVILAIASRSVQPLDDVGHHLGELARLHMP